MANDLGPYPVTSSDLGPYDNQVVAGSVTVTPDPAVVTLTATAPTVTGDAYSGDLTSAGWSTIPTMTTGRAVYVDATGGSDSNDGLSSGAAKATIAAGVALMRTGYDDHLLLKRGESWAEQLDLGWSGIDSDRPSVITGYGDSNDPAPIVNNIYNALNVGTCSYIWVVDVELTNGFRAVSTGTDIRLEGVVVPPGENDALVFNGIDGQFTNITIYRCVVYGRYPLVSTGHVQGMYLGNVHGALVSECFFDENGWSVTGTREGDATYGPATIFNHNIYIQYDGSDIQVEKLWSSRASSHGIQLRTGGTLKDSTFHGNPINVLVGTNLTAPTYIRRNVVVKGTDINSTTTRGWGFEVTTSDYLCEVRYNIAAHQSDGTGPVLFRVSDSGATTENGIVADNVFYKWNMPVEISNGVAGYQLLRNEIQNATGDIVQSYPSGLDASEDNVYYTADADGTRFQYNGSNVTDASWKSSVSDSGSTLTDLSGTYTDPEKDMDDYAVSIGLADADALLTQIRTQRKYNWDLNLTPDRINAYFRANFDMIPAPSSFTATKDGVDVDLESTSYAPESDSFVFQRSPNGVDTWTQIATPTSPSATDTNPGAGTWYYRCAAVVDAVTGDWSDVVSVTFSDGGASNPSGNGTWAFWW